MSEIPKIARARLRQQAAGAGSHPDADQMTAFLERSLGPREREQVLEHLARCAECREVAATALPEEEAARVAQPAPGFLGFQWQTLRWAAVAATFVIAVTLVFQSYRETPEKFSPERARSQSPAATTPATTSTTAPAETVKPGQAANADEAQAARAYHTQPPVPGGIAGKEKTANSSTVAVLRDHEGEAVNGPSKLGGVSRTKLAPKPGEMVAGAGTGGGTSGGVGGFAVGGRMDDSKKLGSEGKAEAGGTLAKAAAAPQPSGTVTGSKGGPAAPAPQQQVAGLAQQAPPSPPAAREEVQRQAAAEPASHAAADQTEAAKVTGQNEMVSVESVEKDADKRARNGALAGGLTESRKMSAAAKARWSINAEGRVQRSVDSGETWKSTALDSHIKFRSVAAAGTDIWAGGEGGALYHSSDSGAHWTRVALPAELASATIVRVEFPSAQHGTLATSAGEAWATSDGGATWQKK